jgi:hypothetical protein
VNAPLGSAQERLLATSSDDVPVAMRDALREFCDGTSEIEIAYLCRVERSRPGAAPQTTLQFAIKLARRVDGPDDAYAESVAVLTRLSEQHPDLAKELGLSVLADRGVGAWEAKAERVFDRSVE